MNHYEQKQQERKERLAARAAKVRQESEKLSTEGWEALAQIPFGQPILRGGPGKSDSRISGFSA